MQEPLTEIKMYSDYKSPYAYMAFEPVFDFEKRYRVRVRWIPFQLRLKGKGQRSEYTEFKVKYSYMDARRWGNERGMWFKGPLKIYDTRPALIGGLYAERHGLLHPYSLEVWRRFFLREFEADQSLPVIELLASMGCPADEVRAYLEGPGQDDYERAQDEAAADHCFGVPICYLEGEPFWGYDRIDMLEDALQARGLARTEDVAG